MAGTITHYWNGSVLTITSDSGTSSADLSGPTGCRGPQGRPGVIYDSDGNLYLDDIPSGAEVDALSDRMDALESSHSVTTEYVATKIEAELADYYTKEQTNEKLANVSVDLTGYATEEYVNEAVANIEGGGAEVDLTNYATKSYVNSAVANAEVNVDLTDYPTFDEMSAAIAQAQLGGDSATIDLSGYATKTDVAKIADNSTIIYDSGKISTSFGGELIGSEGGELIEEYSGKITHQMVDDDDPYFYLMTSNIPTTLTAGADYKFVITINNGATVTLRKVNNSVKWQDVNNNAYFSQAAINQSYGFIRFRPIDYASWKDDTYKVTNLAIYNAVINTYDPIDANALPIDNTTIVVNEFGKLEAVGGSGDYATTDYVDEAIANAQMEGAEVDLSNYYTKSEVDTKVETDLSNYYTKAQVEAYVTEIELQIQEWVMAYVAENGGSSVPSSEEVEY